MTADRRCKGETTPAPWQLCPHGDLKFWGGRGDSPVGYGGWGLPEKTPGSMSCFMSKALIQAVHPVLASRDVMRSIRFFEALGFAPTFVDDPNEPRYVAVCRDGVELHLQWQDPTSWETPGDRPVFRFLVRDVDALFAEFRTKPEISGMMPVMDTSWGTREFHVRDPDRNGLQFYQPRPTESQ